MSSDSFLTIAIDGGAASGKSSTSRILADKYHLMHVDTGAHYRAISFFLDRAGIGPGALEMIEGFLRTVYLTTEVSGNRALIRVNGYLPHETELKSDRVNACVSRYSAIEIIRNKLLVYQQDQITVAKEHHFEGMVMEGRDIGTVVMPDASYRFFLHADAAVRQARRNNEGLLDIITDRDHIDTNRHIAPLKCPEGAIDIDTTQLKLEDVVEMINQYIKES